MAQQYRSSLVQLYHLKINYTAESFSIYSWRNFTVCSESIYNLFVLNFIFLSDEDI